MIISPSCDDDGAGVSAPFAAENSVGSTSRTADVLPLFIRSEDMSVAPIVPLLILDRCLRDPACSFVEADADGEDAFFCCGCCCACKCSRPPYQPSAPAKSVRGSTIRAHSASRRGSTASPKVSMSSTLAAFRAFGAVGVESSLQYCVMLASRRIKITVSVGVGRCCRRSRCLRPAALLSSSSESSSESMLL